MFCSGILGWLSGEESDLWQLHGNSVKSKHKNCGYHDMDKGNIVNETVVKAFRVYLL